MKTINTYITEKLKIPKRGSDYTLFPKDRDELIRMIKVEINENGNECSLNHIDTSKITDMSYLFENHRFNGDISMWNVSNVKNMNGMFYNSYFNGDISKWSVSKVENTAYMFYNSDFNGDISKWSVQNVTNMIWMFSYSKFNQDISDWKINPECNTKGMFKNCNIKDEYRPFKNGERIK